MTWHRRANPAPNPEEAAARERTCPTCGEPPGSRCNTEGGHLMTYSHAARRKMAGFTPAIDITRASTWVVGNDDDPQRKRTTRTGS